MGKEIGKVNDGDGCVDRLRRPRDSVGDYDRREWSRDIRVDSHS